MRGKNGEGDVGFNENLRKLSLVKPNIKDLFSSAESDEGLGEQGGGGCPVSP